MPSNLVELAVNGKLFSGWTQVEIVDSLEAITPAFTLGYTDARKPGSSDSSSEKTRIDPGDLCELRIGDETIITGHVDEATIEEDRSSRSLTVSGRSRTADLVDCSALRAPPNWKCKKLDEIAKDLCEPFGIEVSVSDKTKVGAPFATFAIEPAESALDCLSRAARQRGLLLQSTASGDLEIVTAGERSSGTQLKGDTASILSSSLARSLTERYSEIRVRSQANEEDLFGREQAQAEMVATDSSVPRHRPLVVLSDCAETKAQLKARAEWEVSARAGKGSRLTLKVRGWRNGEELFRPNTLMRVVHQWLGLDDELLLAAVSYTLTNEDGTLATLQFCPKGAFVPEPYVPKKKKGDTWP